MDDIRLDPLFHIVLRTFFLEDHAKPRALDPVKNVFEGIAIILYDMFSDTSKNATTVRNPVLTKSHMLDNFLTSEISYKARTMELFVKLCY